MQEVTEPAELSAARAQREKFDRNSAWLQEHIAEIYSRYRGQFICVAGEEVFVGDTVREAVAKARAAHPDDDGSFTRYIPQEKVPRVYVHFR